MKIPYFCCIGAELKRYEKDFDFMNQVYLYKVPTDDTIEEVFAQDYFQPIAETVLQDDIIYIYEPTTRMLYACRFHKQNGHITAEKMENSIIPELTPNKILISDATGHIAAGDVSPDDFLKKAGDTMSGALNIANIASSNAALLTLTHSNTATYKWNIAPRYNSTTLSVYPGSAETNGFRFATTGFVPASDNARYLGSASLKWKGVYTGALNNGADLVVPNKAGTLATMGDVELAARSGRQLTDQGVWYAKMYAATVAPAAENGTNYADFSQVDGQGNPIIVTYNRVNGAWVQDQTITPPAEYDGYVIVTSKIWDIAEQTGQQGGRVLWNHTSKEFTPYPQIISFENAALTGDSTVQMPATPTSASITSKGYVDNALSGKADSATTLAGYGITDAVAKGHEVIEFQAPTAANNHTWYRKYADGWVEMGGTCAPEYAGATVSFPITMANTNYQFQLSVGQGQITGTVGAVVDNRTTTGMTVYSNWSATAPSYICWEVKGMAA